MNGVFWGLLLVMVDVRADGLDVVPDPVGWLFVVIGLAPLVGRSPWLRAAAVTAGFGVLLSLPGVLGEPTGLLLVAEGVVEVAVVFSVCTAIIRLVGPPYARTADRIRWLILVLVVGFTVLGLLAEDAGVTSDEIAIPLIVAAVAVLAAAVCFLVLLRRVRRHPGLQPTAAVHA